MDIYVGADWSATEVVCSVGIGDKPPRRIASAKRNSSGVTALLERVRALDPRIGAIHVIIEAGAPGWVELFHHAGAVVHVVDPKQAKAFAESLCSSGAKDDARDSDNLVALGRSPRHLPRVWVPRDDFRTQLEALGALHETFTQESGAAQQRLRSALREQMPALEALLEDLSRGWVRTFLRAVPTAWHASKLTEEAIRELLKGSGSRKTTRDAVVEALRDSGDTWVTEAVARTLAMKVNYLLEQIELLDRQTAEIEKEMDGLTRDMDLRKQLESVGGIGAKMAHRLIEYAFDEEPQEGDPQQHRDQASIRLGASPVFRGSAKTKKGKAKGIAVMRRAAAPRARATTYLLGRLASQQLGWAGAMYADGRERGQRAATVYRRIARSLLRVLTAMRRTGERYDDARYVATLKAKGVPWASELAAA